MSAPATGNPPLLAVSSLGRLGRFGNQVFQYFFLRACALKSGAATQCPDWAGKRLFGLTDPPVTISLPPAIERWENGRNLFDEFPSAIKYVERLTGKPSVRIGPEALQTGASGVDLCGHFQYHTRHYRPYKDFLISLLQPIAEFRTELDAALEKLRHRGRTIIGIHVRLGDYQSLPHYGNTLCTPPSWWCDWLRGIWHNFEKPILFICSDSLDACLPQFAEFQPLTFRDLNLPWVADKREFLDYADFYLLTQTDVLGISNSTFSFVAAMLNQNARLFIRPHWDFQSRFRTFDPWDSDPLLYYGECQCLFKPFGGALSVAYATGGVKSLVRSLALYPWKRGIVHAQGVATWARTVGLRTPYRLRTDN